MGIQTRPRKQVLPSRRSPGWRRCAQRGHLVPLLAVWCSSPAQRGWGLQWGRHREISTRPDFTNTHEIKDKPGCSCPQSGGFGGTNLKIRSTGATLSPLHPWLPTLREGQGERKGTEAMALLHSLCCWTTCNLTGKKKSPFYIYSAQNCKEVSCTGLVKPATINSHFSSYKNYLTKENLVTVPEVLLIAKLKNVAPW